MLREGDHFVMTDGTRVLTIPRNDPVNAITMDGIVRDAGLTEDRFPGALLTAPGRETGRRKAP